MADSGRAASAAAVLSRAMQGGFDPIKLSLMQKEARDEMARNLSRVRPGDPTYGTGATYADLQSLDEDIHNDPYTGDAEQRRVGDINDALDKANLSVQQPIEDASQATASRNAFGAFLNSKAKYQADNSPDAQAALDAASKRKIAENNAASGSKLAEQIALLDAKGVTPNAQTASSLTSLDEVERLAPQVLQRLREENPGIENNPGKYGGVMDTAAQQGKRFLYNIGLYKPNEDIGQMTQLLRVIAARPYMNGRPNQRVYNDIVSHLGEFGFSPGADYSRISKILELVPEMREGAIAGQQPLPRVRPGAAPAAGNNVIADPNWGLR